MLVGLEALTGTPSKDPWIWAEGLRDATGELGATNPIIVARQIDYFRLYNFA